MKCEICNENLAVIQLTQIIDGESIETNICESCASKNTNLNILGNFDLGNIFKILGNSEDFNEEKNEKHCSNCNINYSEIINRGKIGCPQCYIDFEKEFEELFKSMYGRDKHIGKTPSKFKNRLKEEIKIENLQRELDEAVKTENYEKAAVLRDEIRHLKNLKY